MEYATLELADRFNQRRLPGPIDDVLPDEFEQAYYDRLEELARAA